MYVRTIVRRRNDGSVVESLQLVEKFWDPDKKRACTRIIASLGRTNEEGKVTLYELYASIRKRLSSDEIEWLDSLPEDRRGRLKIPNSFKKPKPHNKG